MSTLSKELYSLPEAIKSRVNRDDGLSNEQLLRLVKGQITYNTITPLQTTKNDVIELQHQQNYDEYEQLGEVLINSGQVAFVVCTSDSQLTLAQLSSVGTTLLGWKLMQAGNMPVWIMCTPQLSHQLHAYISGLILSPGLSGTILEQYEGYCLNPDNSLYIEQHKPRLYSLGSGDLAPLYVSLIHNNEYQNVKYVVVCHVNNVLAQPNAGLLGYHVKSKRQITCEVTHKLSRDSDSILTLADTLQLVDQSRLHDDFIEQASFISTGMMILNADVLKQNVNWEWQRIRKHVNNKIVVQYERSIQQYTSMFNTNYVLVPRETHYCYVKSESDLAHANTILQTHKLL